VLRQEGHEVIELREGLPVQASDFEAFGYARNHGLFLITCNRDDFLALAAEHSNPGIIVLVHQVRGWFSGVELKMSRRQGAEEEAYLNRYVTDEQRSRRLIFSSTPWAVQNWRFWRVARSTRMIHIQALRSRLPKSPILRRRR
jgi:hypothetical protein